MQTHANTAKGESVDVGFPQMWRQIAPLATVVLLTCLAYVVTKGASLLVQAVAPRAVWPRAIHRRLALLSFTVVCASTGGARAGGERPVAPRGESAKPPWSGSGGSPPPLPPVPTKGQDARRQPPGVHPAIHGQVGTGDPVTPLFPRKGATSPWDKPRSPSRLQTEEGDRSKGAMPSRPTPTGQKDGSRCCSRLYVVRSGDTLWDIAATVLRTDDPRRIARYWPRLHRANRAVVGPNPNVILAGQVLELPEDSG